MNFHNADQHGFEAEADLSVLDPDLDVSTPSLDDTQINTVPQTTLCSKVTLTGIGVHSGAPSTLTLHPAKANSGISFRRRSDCGKVDKLIPAHVNAVSDTRLCTILGPMDDLHVATVEHLMAALSALAVDNVIIEVSAREVPVMDGSSSAFVDAIRSVGLTQLDAPRRYIKVLRPVRAELDHCEGELAPFEGRRFDVEINFPSPAIGHQRFINDLDADSFADDIAAARTFGFMEDAVKLRQMGLAQGSSLENSVVIDQDKVINEDGLRFEDEFVRHKLLDAIGDLALAGAPILGAYTSTCGGHRLNAMMLEALFADEANWCFTTEAPVSELRAAATHDLPVAKAAKA